MYCTKVSIYDRIYIEIGRSKHIGDNMKLRHNLKKNFMIVLIVASTLMLLFPVAFLMNHVQTLLNNDVKVNLTEIVTQNKDVINGKIQAELESLKVVGSQLIEDAQRIGELNDANLNTAFYNYVSSRMLNNIFIVNTEGVATFDDGVTMDVGGRKYYKSAMQKKSSLSEKTISRKTGEEVFIVSVPILYQDNVIGTIQKSFTNQEIQDLFALSLYSASGYIYMINSEGYILYHSNHKDCHRGSDNYYRDLYEQGAPEESKQLSAAIQDNKTGFLETKLDSGEYFAAFTPLEGLYDWYLVSSVQSSVVMYNSTIVVKTFYGILVFLVLFFAIIASIFWSYKNKQQKKLQEIAFVDPVTKGGTENKFINDLQNLLINEEPDTLSVLKFDIDNFKYINKYYGFDYGDALLCSIVNTFEENLVKPEMIARISSDNFVVLLKDDHLERVNNLFEAVQDKQELMIFLSAGLYKIQDMQENVNLMIDKASMASNTVKENMNNKICYYDASFDQQIKNDEELKREIQKGLENNEFIPYYQPKVDINDGSIIGAEALVRWKHPKKGLVSPGLFIPLCEKTGKITELDLAVYEQTLHFLQKLKADGIPVYPISVNFSRMHLTDLSFLNKLHDLANEHEINPKLIQIEITESAIFDNMEMLLEFTKLVHDKGFTLAMDDFGSGYSSLNMLKNISIDILKVDKEFLSASNDPSRRKIIFETMVEMAQKLKIEMIVEGVETLENVELMKECRCYCAQGFYFARPMEEEKIIELFKKGKVS